MGTLRKHKRNVDIQDAPSPILFSSKVIWQILQDGFKEIKPLKTLPLLHLGQ